MFFLRSDLGPRRLCAEKYVTVMSTAPGCDVTTVQQNYKGSTSTPPRVARLCQIREASLVALRKFHKSTLAHMCRSFDSSNPSYSYPETSIVNDVGFFRSHCCALTAFDAQTREKNFGWLTEKRPQKAWLSPPVVTHQNNSTRCSLGSRQIFDSF